MGFTENIVYVRPLGAGPERATWQSAWLLPEEKNKPKRSLQETLSQPLAESIRDVRMENIHRDSLDERRRPSISISYQVADLGSSWCEKLTEVNVETSALARLASQHKVLHKVIDNAATQR